MSAARRSWVQRMLEGIPGPIVEFGSPEWLALPDGDPRKRASVIVAAESWARDGDELEERLRREVLALSRANKRAEDADYVATHEQHARTWKGGAYHPDPDLSTQLEAEFWDWIRGAA